MLAQAVTMTSPLLHFADHYKFYIGNPAEEILRAVPSTWDETIVLPGSKIGEVVGFARRRGTDWYIGVHNGANPVAMQIDLEFLGAGVWQAVTFGDNEDNTFKRESRVVRASDNLQVEMRPKGGFVAQLKATRAQ
jgi:alpha-glucosidase